MCTECAAMAGGNSLGLDLYSSGTTTETNSNPYGLVFVSGINKYDFMTVLLKNRCLKLCHYDKEKAIFTEAWVLFIYFSLRLVGYGRTILFIL